jgi:hypothetical protein
MHRLALIIALALAGCAAAPQEPTCTQVRAKLERQQYGHSCATNPSCIVAIPRQIGTC